MTAQRKRVDLSLRQKAELLNVGIRRRIEMERDGGVTQHGAKNSLAEMLGAWLKEQGWVHSEFTDGAAIAQFYTARRDANVAAVAQAMRETEREAGEDEAARARLRTPAQAGEMPGVYPIVLDGTGNVLGIALAAPTPTGEIHPNGSPVLMVPITTHGLAEAPDMDMDPTPRLRQVARMAAECEDGELVDHTVVPLRLDITTKGSDALRAQLAELTGLVREQNANLQAQHTETLALRSATCDLAASVDALAQSFDRHQ